MRKLLAIAVNDLRREFSERATLVFFFLLPVAFTVVIGQGLGGGGEAGQPEPVRYQILIVDEDQSSLSTAVIEALNTSPSLSVTTGPAGEVNPALDDDQVQAALTLPAGFGAGLQAGQEVQVGLETSENDQAGLAAAQTVQAGLAQIDAAVSAAQASVEEARRIKPFTNQQAERAYFDDRLAAALATMQQAPPARVEMTQSDAAAESAIQSGDGFTQSSPGQLVTWTLITLLGASEVFVNERLGGTLRRLLAAPTRAVTILLGKIGGRLAMGWVQMAILIGFGALVLGVNWGRSPGALLLVVVSFSLAAVSLGVLLGAFSKTRGQASGLTILFSMVLAALGGAWWPLEITPPLYQTVVKVLPTTWAMLGFNDVILRGAGVQAVLPEAAILIGFAALFFAASIPRLRFW